MADFVAVLKKTIDGLGETTPEVREKVYQKARKTIEAKLAALNPPAPAAVADRQRRQLDDAIRAVEAEFAPPQPKESADPLSELDALFAELTPSAAEKPAAEGAKPEPATGTPAGRSAVPGGHASPAGKDADAIATESGETAPASDGMAEDEAGAPEGEADDDRAAGRAPTEAADGDIRNGSRLRMAIAAVIALVLVGGGYAAWLNKDSLVAMMSGGDASTPQSGPETPVPATGEEEPAAGETDVAAAPAGQEDGETDTPAEEPEAGATQKFTQRLQADGSEVDAGPAGGEASIGEGTSVASASQSSAPEETTPPAEATAPDAQEEAAADSGEPAVPVGQKAIYYEERTSVAEGSAEPGSIVWSLVQESPGADLPPEPAIRAEATIPGKDVQLRMTIRRNGDQSLPASHIIELIFLTPDGFGGGGIENVLRMTMKDSEQSAGNPLLGIPAKIADGFFLIALNDGEAAVEANTTMMRRLSWIDVPVVYKSGRRALVTMEKGLPGEKVFEEALKAWQSASSG